MVVEALSDQPVPSAAAAGTAPAIGLTLICGPAGGGKSRWAEHLAGCSGRHVVYLATGPLLPEDADWQRRLQRHRLRRPSHWLCREVGGQLASALLELRAGEIGLIDSLGTWVAAWLDADASSWRRCCDDLIAALHRCEAPLLLVVEEVGWGVVPSSAAGGRFRQRLADLEQRLMADAAAAWLVMAGRALDLLRHSLPVPQDT